MWVAFAMQKLLTFFQQKISEYCNIESAKTVNEMTLNELVKLTTLWTTGPRTHPKPTNSTENDNSSLTPLSLLFSHTIYEPNSPERPEELILSENLISLRYPPLETFDPWLYDELSAKTAKHAPISVFAGHICVVQLSILIM